jgi:hypothetical protein
MNLEELTWSCVCAVTKSRRSIGKLPQVIWTMGLQSGALQVLLCGRRPHLYIMYVLYKYHSYLGVILPRAAHSNEGGSWL